MGPLPPFLAYVLMAGYLFVGLGLNAIDMRFSESRDTQRFGPYKPSLYQFTFDAVASVLEVLFWPIIWAAYYLIWPSLVTLKNLFLRVIKRRRAL